MSSFTCCYLAKPVFGIFVFGQTTRLDNGSTSSKSSIKTSRALQQLTDASLIKYHTLMIGASAARSLKCLHIIS